MSTKASQRHQKHHPKGITKGTNPRVHKGSMNTVRGLQSHTIGATGVLFALVGCNLLFKLIAVSPPSAWVYWPLVHIQVLLALAWLSLGNAAFCNRACLVGLFLFLLTDFATIEAPPGAWGMLRGDWESAMTNRGIPTTYIDIVIHLILWAIPSLLLCKNAARKKQHVSIVDILWLTLLVAFTLSLYSRMYRSVHGGLLRYFTDFGADLVDLASFGGRQFWPLVILESARYSVSALLGTLCGVTCLNQRWGIIRAALAAAILVSIPSIFVALNNEAMISVRASYYIEGAAFVTASGLFAAISHNRLRLRWMA